MEITQDNYLDLYNILVYELIGKPTLAMAIGVILIAYFSAKSAMPFQITLLMIFLYLAIMAAITKYFGAWVLVVLSVGILFYWILSRILRRG